MKKITFLVLSFVLFLFGYAQQTISFEASEGFALGDINGQNGWTVTGCEPGCFIDNQIISNAFATDGSNSFKIAVDPTFGIQDPIMGGFYDFTAPIDNTNATFSYDIYITNHAVNEDSDFLFGVTGEDTEGNLDFTFAINFGFENDILIIDNQNVVVIGTWSNNIWYNVRAEVTGSIIKYFIDNVEAYQGSLINNFNFTGLRFVHDNYGGEAYLDNLRINNEPLSVDNQILESLTVYPNPTSDFVHINVGNAITIEKVSMVDVLGKTVEIELSNNILDISGLSDGVFFLKIETSNGSATKKIIKN